MFSVNFHFIFQKLTFYGKWKPFRRRGKLSQTGQGQSPIKCNYQPILYFLGQ